jgi:hypothetical protein
MRRSIGLFAATILVAVKPPTSAAETIGKTFMIAYVTSGCHISENIYIAPIRTYLRYVSASCDFRSKSWGMEGDVFGTNQSILKTKTCKVGPHPPLCSDGTKDTLGTFSKTGNEVVNTKLTSIVSDTSISLDKYVTRAIQWLNPFKSTPEVENRWEHLVITIQITPTGCELNAIEYENSSFPDNDKKFPLTSSHCEIASGRKLE